MIVKLQKLIAEKGLTQTGFEPMVGLPANRISKWAGGQGEPTARQLQRIARALDVSLDYLADDSQDEPSPRPSTDRERQVWEIIRRYGAEWAYWRLVEAVKFDQAGIPEWAGEEISADRNDRRGKTG